MIAPGSNTRSLQWALLLCSLACVPAQQAFAQDSAFLACERFTDRGQRIACLEDALEAATAEDSAAEAVRPAPAERPAAASAPAPAAPAPAPAPAAPAPAPAPAAAAPATAADAEDSSLLERLRGFGRATLSSDAEGQDQLHDTITALEQRRGLWVVTLSSGQVWRQSYPRTLHLREGDQVTIYQAGIGNGYRLSTERLSGFIRVERVR